MRTGISRERKSTLTKTKLDRCPRCGRYWLHRFGGDYIKTTETKTGTCNHSLMNEVEMTREMVQEYMAMEKELGKS